MSTIEKAAARLVEKAKTVPKPKPVPEPVNDAVVEPLDDAALVEVAVDAETSATLEERHLEERQLNGVSAEVSSQPVSQSDSTSASQPPVAPLHDTVLPVPGTDTIIEKTCELNFPWLADNGFLVPGHNLAKQAQEFRRIKRPLLLNLQPRVAEKLPVPPNLIFVTSSLPAEGKTFVSLNLALSLSAELDKHVLLVDGDAAKGDLSRWMGIHGETGLVDLLSIERSNGEGAVIETNVDRLRVMPCGAARDNLDELYASSLMSTLLSGLARHDPNRIIVVDGPPLLATTEAAVLARLMGQVVMVIEANKTPRSAAEEAVGLLEDCQKVSLLLNKTSQAQSGTYGYGYGYGYGTTPSSARSGPEEEKS